MGTVGRVIFMYIFIVIGMRLLGKREFGQLAPMEFVSLILIPDFVSQAVIGDDFSMTNALIAITTLFAMVFLSSLIAHLSKRAEHVIEGEPCVMIYNGKFLESKMNKERITPEEIFSEMHKSGIETLSQVKWAILEGDGKISFIRADQGSDTQSN